MKKAEATNTFQDGLIMDLNPMVSPNSTLCNALNATLITMNGNENVLLNDMGNGRVETAYLPEGYIPLGTTLLGGIIYIVSYNPLIDKCLIGSFPSPERNVTSDELGETNKSLYTSNFYSSYSSDPFSAIVSSPSLKLMLTDAALNPGDKFIVFSSGINSYSYISAKTLELVEPSADLYPKYLKLSVVAVLDNGKITNLNDSLTWYVYSGNEGYYIYNGTVTLSNDSLSVDEYRNLVTSNYSVFTSKVSGKLGILAELEVIETFEVAWDAYKEDDKWNIYFLLNWTYSNEKSHDKVNLYGIKVEESGESSSSSDIVITTYPKSTYGSDNDALNNQSTTFYTPCYVKNYLDYIEDTSVYSSNNGITTPRYNDNTDNLFFLGTPYTVSSESGVIILTVSPVMPFGTLDYLKQSITIDLDALGSGEIDLTNYKYYWEESGVTLNWALEAYPEYNKTINSVTFSFYEYDEDVSSWILSNAENIDNSRIEDGVWYNKSDDEWVAGSTASVYSGATSIDDIVISNKSSYSGYFLNVIEGLNNNSLYLVAITIDYNGEKTITYYRFLYTSKIFNNYYFDSDYFALFDESGNIDFKYIILLDALDTYYPITITASDYLTSFEKEEVLTDSSDEEVSALPYALSSSNSSSNYKLTSTYSSSDDSNVTFNISAENEVFEIEIEEISADSSSITIEYSNDASEETLYSSSSGISTSSNLDDITLNPTISNIELDSTTGSFLLENTLVTPFLVDYSKEETVAIEYEMTALSYVFRNLECNGRHKGIYINVNDSTTYLYNSDGDYYADVYGDDSDTEGTLLSFSGIYEQLQNDLVSNDLVMLRIYCNYNACSGDNLTRLYYNNSYKQYNPTSSQNATKCAVGYAMKSSDDTVYIWIPICSGSYYGAAKSSSDSGSSSTNFVVGAYSNLTESRLFSPFSECFKAVETSETTVEYTYYKICYYDNYNWTVTFEIPCSETISIVINDTKLEYDDANLPNNLYYNKELETPITGNISDTIYTDTHIENLTKSTSSTFILDLNGDLVEAEVSPKKLYNADLEEVTKLPAPDGSTTDPLDMKSSFTASLADSLLRVTVSSVKKASVLFDIEEQKIKINNLILLT